LQSTDAIAMFDLTKRVRFDPTELDKPQQMTPGSGTQFGRLNLGRVREIATVIVNGHRLETTWRTSFAARIDPVIHAGNNTIEIQVTNLWPNRLIGDLQLSATQHFTHTNVRAYSNNSPLLPSGILEPILLEPCTVLVWR